ncbi:hypothetical protein BDR06DRAFT_1060478 [Suillus hirtellus]|nr:hypothetical protein BDR06DRAFT_1060478 [Suillus hirtellus]
MARTKIKSTGGSARTISALSTITTANATALALKPSTLAVPPPMLETADAHSMWCMICRDGSEGPIVLKCIEVPDSYVDIMQRPTVSFLCLVCHSKATLKSLAPFYQFYTGGLPSQGGKEVLPSFLHLNGKYEMASSSIMAAGPIAFIHFILGGEDPICTPVSIICKFLEMFYPNGGFTYVEVTFNITSHERISEYELSQVDRVLYTSQALKENGSGLEYVAMIVSHVLTTVLLAYLMVLKNAHIVFLVCGSVIAHPKPYDQLMSAILHFEFASAIMFIVKHFQPLVASNFFLVFAELVLVEQLCVCKTFPELLLLSGHLGLHIKVILMTLDPLVLTASWSTQHLHVPTPKLSLGEWRCLRSALNVVQPKLAETSDPSVTRYVYSCKYSNYGTAQRLAPHKLVIERPLDFMVNSARTTKCGWFQDDPVDLPKALKRATRHYYHQFITDEDNRKAKDNIFHAEQEADQSIMSPEEREANACPKDASFYKKQLTDWDIAQKLFKQEMDNYDKEEQQKMGVPHSIQYQTGYAQQWFNSITFGQKKEVQQARDKWNKEGALLESQAIHESEPLACKKALTFSEWSKQEFYPYDNEDEDDDQEEEEPEDKPFLPEIVLDKENFRQLPSWTDVSLKGQQELICQIIHASYNLNCVPKGFVFKDPSHMRTVDMNRLWHHWKLRKLGGEKLIIFIESRVTDLSAAQLVNAIPLERIKKRKIYMEINKEPAKPSSPVQCSITHTEQLAKDLESNAMASPTPTSHMKRPANDATFNKLASSRSTKCARKLADDADTSEEDKAISAPTPHLKGLVGHPSSAQLGVFAAVPMKNHMPFLWTLSSNPEYLCFVEGLRDLQKEQASKHPEGFPSWATWSWERSYLPNTMHDLDNELLKFLQLVKSTKVFSFASVMQVALGLRMLVRECKQVIEYEADEATPDTPSYISTLVLDIKCLDLVLETISTARGGVVHLSKVRAGKQPQEVAGIEGDGPGNIAQNAADGGQKVQKDIVEWQQKMKLLEEEMEKMVVLKEEVRKLQEAKEKLEEAKQMLEKGAKPETHHVDKGHEDHADVEEQKKDGEE